MQDMRDLKEPIQITVETPRGPKVFILSKFGAVSGREIVVKWHLAKTTVNYDMSQEVMRKMMSYVGVEVAAGNIVRLHSDTLIDSHAGDWVTLKALEDKIMDYNCDFFPEGKA